MSSDDVTYWNVRLMKDWRRGFWPDEARDQEAFWDGRADGFRQATSDRSSRDYAAALVRCIRDKARLQATDTCLDLGCGTGALALPLARRVHRVTACDISGQMLRHLAARARQEHADNVMVVHKRWMDLTPCRDIGPHDIVIAHRSLNLIACDHHGTPDFVECITRMDRLARRAAFIIPRAFALPDDDEFRQQFPECMHDPAVRFSDLTTLNLLYAMGLSPCLEYVHLRQTRCFRSIEDEVASFRRFHRLHGVRRLKRLRDYLAAHATRGADGYALPVTTRTMVIWWSKAS